MLAVTVSVLSSGGSVGRFRAFVRALVYVAGIATMYSALGVAAALSGGLLGGILQSRVVLLAVAFIFVVLSAGMFGLYEIKLPPRLADFLGKTSAAGYAGLYLSGLFVGIFAAPCAGPPLAGLMTMVAQRGDPFFGLAAFFILSAGLGLPYVVLGTFSGLLRSLPKSGAWMLWVKKVFAFALAAAGVFYFSLAVSPRLVFVLLPAVLFAAGVYLLLSHREIPGVFFRTIKYAFAAACALAAVLVFMSGRRVSVAWTPYSGEVYSQAVKSGRATLIYFSADWCVPCLELDRRTFTDGKLREKLSGINTVKVDLTGYESPQSAELRERFAITGVPTMVFLDASGAQIKNARVVGFLPASALLNIIEDIESGVLSASDVAAASDVSGDELSSAVFVAETDVIKPGEPFYAGVLFTMRGGWHAYWLNPGDSGMAPQIKWRLPDGFKAGPILWPHPRRFDDPPFATFGHENTLLVFRRIMPPVSLKKGSRVRLSADVSWLICKDICVAQDASTEILLKVSDDLSSSVPRKNIFDEARKSLPADDPSWRFAARHTGREIELKMSPPSGVSRDIAVRSVFFPLQSGLVRTQKHQWRRDGSSYLAAMRLEPSAVVPEKLEGVLVLPDFASPRGFPRAINVAAEIKRGG